MVVAVIFKLVAICWFVVTMGMGVFVLVEDQYDVHGTVAPDFCTDCAQFKQWLEDQ
jgi:hypothetical protein